MNYNCYFVGTYSFDIKLILRMIKKEIDHLLEKIEKTEQKLA